MRDRDASPPLWLCVAILTAVFAVMARWTWFGWPDPIVDFGRELYVPWQLSTGKVLYRDIAYFNGPLAPYLNALIFKVFGPSLRTLALTNLLLLVGLTAMLFALLSSIFNRLAALIGGAVQLTIFSFIQLAGIGNYNFVTPYSHELTHGLILSIAALLISGRNLSALFRRHSLRIEGPSPCAHGEGGSFLAGLILGLIFLTKIEVFLAAAGALGALLFLRSLETSRDSGSRVDGWRLARNLIELISSAAVPPAIAFGLLRCAMPAADAAHGVIGSFRYALDRRIAGNLFYRHILGTDDRFANLIQMLLMFALDSAIFAAIYVVTRVFGASFFALPVRAEGGMESPEKLNAKATANSPHFPARALSIASAWLVAWITYVAIDSQSWQAAFAALPFLLLAIAAVQWFIMPRDGDSNRVAAVSFTIFAFLLLLKMFFAVRLSQYGFVLALPALLAVVGFLFHTMPELLSARGRDGRLFAWLCLPLIALIIAAHLRPYAQLFARKPISVASGADHFLAGDVRGVAVNRCLAQLAALPPNATVAVLPEGVMLSYLSKKVNPTPFINLMPPEMRMFGEPSILAAFQQHPPDYMVWNDGSNPNEYGYRAFADYAATLNAWIAERYEPLNNPTMPQYPLRILKRRP